MHISEIVQSLLYFLFQSPPTCLCHLYRFVLHSPLTSFAAHLSLYISLHPSHSLSVSLFLLSASLFSLFSLTFLTLIRWLTRNWSMDLPLVWLFGSKTASTFRLLLESYGVLFLSLSRPVRTNSSLSHYFEIYDNNWDTIDRNINVNLIYEMRLK